MNWQPMSRRTCITLLIMVFLFDRVTKWFVINRLHREWTINSCLKLHKIFNTGISWGFLQEATPFAYVLLSIFISFLLLIISGYALIRWFDNRFIVGELLIIAGGFSNLIDRFCYGAVVDFIACSWSSWSFPIFNVADIAIVLGVAIMFYDAWKNR